MRYYSLTFLVSCDGHTVGSRLFNAENSLFIGQQESADIHLVCRAGLLPQPFAVILPNDNGESWRLVRQTDFYNISVNGTSVDYACLLTDGDVIEMAADKPLKLRFSLHDDTSYDSAMGIDYRQKSRTRKIATGLLLVVAILASFIAGLLAFSRDADKFTEADIADLENSVYMIRVEGIMLQMHTPAMVAGAYETIEWTEPSTPTYGTCFFTYDSLCITARHCIEPWLIFDWSLQHDASDIPDEVKWALKAETSVFNREDTTYRVVTECKIYDGKNCILTCQSSDFNFNRSHDDIIRLFDEGYVWRNINPLFSRRDMELGDFAFMKTERKGELRLKNFERDTTWRYDAKEKKLAGYPKTNNVERSIINVDNVFKPELREWRPVTNIKLKVDATEGYSGAPVIVKEEGKMHVIGIMSKSDDYDESNIFYAVPSSEITNYNKEEANEKIIYRR